jgi:DNA polymerase III subunit epsilon
MSAASGTPASVRGDTAVPLDSLEYLVVDLETTGGSPDRSHRVMEVAALRVDGRGRVLEEYRSLVNPGRPIPPYVTRLTRITQDMVSGAPRFGEIAGRIGLLLQDRVFVAHNVSFDWGFLRTELERAGAVWPQDGRSLCTVRLARRLVPELRRRNLDALAYYFGVEIVDRHRAYGDAWATAHIFARLLRCLEDREIYSWQGLQELLQRRRPRRKRTSLPTSAEWVDPI